MNMMGRSVEKSIKDELSGKRLLALGGSLWKGEIQKFCKDNDVLIIAVGNDPNAGIASIADEYYNIDSTNSVEMIDFIQKNRIDGVYLGGSEPVISAACEYVNLLGMPCYCTKDQWEAIQNKSSFKKLCKNHGLPVIERLEPERVGPSDFPVITKPEDGFGSGGFSVCCNDQELKAGYKLAEEVSSSGRVLIERFVPNDSVVVVYTIFGGEAVFSTIEDKYPAIIHNHGTYVGGLFDFESGLKDDFRYRFESKIQAMIKELDISEGSIWMEVFCGNGEYYFNEAGFRYGGSGTLYPVDYFAHINQVAKDIYFSLTGKSRIDGFSHIFNKDALQDKRYAIYPILLKPGTIHKLDGVDSLLNEKNIPEILVAKKPGDSIPDNGSFGQVGLLVHILYNDRTELKDSISLIHEKLSIIDSHGVEMVERIIDPEKIKWRD